MKTHFLGQIKITRPTKIIFQFIKTKKNIAWCKNIAFSSKFAFLSISLQHLLNHESNSMNYFYSADQEPYLALKNTLSVRRIRHPKCVNFLYISTF